MDRPLYIKKQIFYVSFIFFTDTNLVLKCTFILFLHGTLWLFGVVLRKL
jgi:hypothetical protein